jgi:putative transposase
VLGFSTQGFYRWLSAPVTDREWSDAHLFNAIYDIHGDDPEFGYRFIADELEAAGLRACENRVHRLCSMQQVFSTTIRRKRGMGTRPGPPADDDHVQRKFRAASPDVLWLADITEHRTREGKLYLCAIKDACSNRVVGYSIDSRMPAALAVTALPTAIARRGPTARLLVHSDRGSQFRSRNFCRILREHDLVGSMGRVGAAGDNAAMESFFALLQNNVLNRQTWQTRDELRFAIITWIERTYNRRRRQCVLGRLTPSSSKPSSPAPTFKQQHDPHNQPSTEPGAIPLYIVVRSLDPTGRGRRRWMNRWKPALNAFEITFEGRLLPTGE